MNPRSLLLAVLALACAGVVAAETGVAPGEITIGSCSDRSGPSAERAGLQLAGAKAYFDYVNAAGGVHGRKIKLVEYDDAYDPAKAVGCFKQLTDGGSFAGALFLGTPPAVKYMAMAEANKVPVIGFISGASILYNPVKRYVFTVRASSLDATKDQLAHAANDLDLKKVAVIYQNDAYGAHVLEAARQAAESLGSSIVATASYERGSTNVDEAITTIAQAHPDVVVLGAVGAPMAGIVRKAKAAGLTSPLYVTISGDPVFIKEAGKDGDGVVVTQFVPELGEKSKSMALFESQIKKAGKSPNYVSLEGFVDAMVLVEGLKRAGAEPTRETLVSGLEQLADLDLGFGPQWRIGYSAADHKGFNTVLHTVLRGGKAVPVSDWKKLR